MTDLPLHIVLKFWKGVCSGKGDTPKNNQGFFLVEVIVASFILVTVIGSVSAAVTVFSNARRDLLTETKKVYLAEEGYEILRFLRDEDWNNVGGLVVGQRYAFLLATSTLLTTTGFETIDTQYSRSFVLYPAYRSNVTGKVVSATTSGAVIDPDARIVEIAVADPVGTTTLRAIVTNYLE